MVVGPVVLDQLVDLLRGVVREDVGEEIDQVPADVAPQVVFGDRRAVGVSGQSLPDRAADVGGGGQQGAVNVKQVDGEPRDHAGWEPSERPGTRGRLSGRRTCCVWSSESFWPETGGRVWALMICITSLPSRISRCSRVSAILIRASERSSRICAAVL